MCSGELPAADKDWDDVDAFRQRASDFKPDPIRWIVDTPAASSLIGAIEPSRANHNKHDLAVAQPLTEHVRKALARPEPVNIQEHVILPECVLKVLRDADSIWRTVIAAIVYKDFARHL